MKPERTVWPDAGRVAMTGRTPISGVAALAAALMTVTGSAPAPSNSVRLLTRSAALAGSPAGAADR